jgi:3-deoxy-manno-octulosonate cytidylyltransferase (CMP-KDO synthetase)
MNIIGIIPSRFGSTRFPGKPLVDINGTSMIQRVYEQAKKATRLTDVVVATDDQRIFDHVKEFGGQVIMTGPTHQSGTDRCAEIISKDEKHDHVVVINIQGDEPYIHPEQIDQLCACFDDSTTKLATLVNEIKSSDELFNHNNVKVILNKLGEAIYFSRSPIPYCRNFPEQEWIKHQTYYKHIGIYGYHRDTLIEVAKLEKTKLEITESLEQLRWIENGYKIRAEITAYESISIDIPEDLLKVAGR